MIVLLDLVGSATDCWLLAWAVSAWLPDKVDRVLQVDLALAAGMSAVAADCALRLSLHWRLHPHSIESMDVVRERSSLVVLENLGRLSNFSKLLQLTAHIKLVEAEDIRLGDFESRELWTLLLPRIIGEEGLRVGKDMFTGRPSERVYDD